MDCHVYTLNKCQPHTRTSLIAIINNYNVLHFIVITGCQCSAWGSRYKPTIARNCRTFYQWDEWDSESSAVEKSCPFGLMFDSISCRCDYAHRVSCPNECKQLDYDKMLDYSSPVATTDLPFTTSTVAG